jgi:hypothetical protein
MRKNGLKIKKNKKELNMTAKKNAIPQRDGIQKRDIF